MTTNKLKSTLPEGWSSKSLSSVANVVRGSSPRPGGDPRFFDGDFLPWITVADITSSENVYLESTRSMLTEAGADCTRIFEPGTVLLSNSGATLGVPKITSIRAGANDGVAGFLDLNPSIDPLFLYFALSTLTRYFREELAPGVGQPNLNTDLIGNIKLDFPPLSEQRAIVTVLSVWERAIKLKTQLIEGKRQLKQGLMQQLFTGKRRYAGFKEPFRKLRLRDVTKECSERNDLGFGNESVMAVTKAEGIVPMRERLIGASVERYKQVNKDWFAYNPMRINIGSIARSHANDTVLVSPDYVVFRCCEETANQPGIDPDYLDHLRESECWSSFVASSGNGSVRIRIYYNDLAVMPLQLPSIAEQRKVASILNALDSEISLLSQQVVALKTQKKGLMRKLFTGEVRVKGAAA
jgi:type I restriction enzyme S subunit